MKKKVWEFRILDNPNQAIGGENDQFYTTDTEAFLKFKLLDAEFKPTTATLTLVNNASQSVISETVPVVDGLVEWEMYEEAIAHSGNWQAQLVYTQEKAGKAERYTSQVVQFDVQSHLITGRQPALVAIEDWNTFMTTARDLLESFNEDADGKMFDIEQLEQQYLTNETERIAKEVERVSNETERVTEESNRTEAEELRESAEATRITNEATRTTTETTRLSKETERLASETERINAENVRTTNETDRVDSEVERKSNEAIRVNAESVREANESIRQSNNEVVEGWIINRDFDGKDIEFMWDGTNLGVRQEGDTDFQFVDLKGDTGEIENFTAQHIEDALGYMPISEAGVPEPTWANLQNKPTEFNPTSHTHSINDVTGLRAELDSVPELTKENVGLGNVDNVKQASKVDFDNLLENFTGFKGNIGKFKATENGTLEYHDGKEWVEVRGGTEFKVGNTSGFTAEAKAGLKIEIKFGDPEDSIIIDENGNKITLAELGGTQLRAKKDSSPVDENDGILLVDSKVKNQYKDTPFIHDGLTDGEEWFYMAMPYTKAGVFTIDPANRGSAVATNKLNQPAPAAPTISNLKFDRATVTGDNLVSLDKTTWFASPHTFTGLTEETSYTAYAKKKETAEFLESPISTGRAFKTPSDLPGPSELVGGNMYAGYFGHVPASQLFTGAEIAAAVGITQGTAQFNDVGWLKIASEGKVKFKSQKPFRYDISWDHINSKGAVDGSKIVEKDGVKYRVTLMKGGNGNVSDLVNGPKASEWNKIMLPMHKEAKDQSWAYKNNVAIPTEDWGIGFTDADLYTHYNHGNGTYQWCRDVYYDSASYRVLRGRHGVSYQFWIASSHSSASCGWSPVLEVIS